MSFNNHYLRPLLLPWLFYFVAAFVALFLMSVRDWLLPVLFLLLPFVDSQWRMPRMIVSKQRLSLWTAFGVIIAVLLYRNPETINLFAIMVMLAALPEEWFFRSYLQKQLGNNITAVFVVSVLFALMHYIAHDSAVVLLVFFPSIFFGWLYKKSDDLLLVVLMHALFNLVYYLYLQVYIEGIFS